MCAVKASRKGDSHGHTSAPHCFGDFGVSVLHRPGCYRLETSPLNLERLQGSIGDQHVELRAFDRIGPSLRSEISLGVWRRTRHNHRWTDFSIFIGPVRSEPGGDAGGGCRCSERLWILIREWRTNG